MAFNTSHSWQEIMGEKKWAGMLVPLDDDLRMYLLHYGERVQAIGDAFNNEDVSPSCNFSRYPMKDFFSYVGLEINNPYKYEVKKFVYTENLLFGGETTWIAYVAVATDEAVEALGRRDILVSWRGTIRPNEFLVDIAALQVSPSEIFGKDSETLVHFGWYQMYAVQSGHDVYTEKTARSQVLDEIESLVKTYGDKDISITIAGYSMGGALATLNGADIVFNEKNKLPGGNTCPVTVFAFSSPMVGNESFQKKVDGLENLHILRTQNLLDIVPQLPPINYYHVGQVLQVDSCDSKYLKNLSTGASKEEMLLTAHQLEPLLHLVAGTTSMGQEFDLKGRRDLALVNKAGDCLTDEEAKANKVPKSWWVVKNKGMIQKAIDGKWVLDDYKPPAP